MNERTIAGTVRTVAFAAALLMFTVLVVTRSQAAFTSTTSAPTSGFNAGTVGLTDDDAGNALFTASGMYPNNPLVRCIRVTYDGSLTPAPVRLYGTSAGSLAPYLDVKVDVGTGGAFSDCAGFSSSATLFDGTLSGFSATHGDWATGRAAFTAASTPTTRTFRFTVTVQDTDAAQGLSATAAFTWETQV